MVGTRSNMEIYDASVNEIQTEGIVPRLVKGYAREINDFLIGFDEPTAAVLSKMVQPPIRIWPGGPYNTINRIDRRSHEEAIKSLEPFIPFAVEMGKREVPTLELYIKLMHNESRPGYIVVDDGYGPGEFADRMYANIREAFHAARERGFEYGVFLVKDGKFIE